MRATRVDRVDLAVDFKDADPEFADDSKQDSFSEKFVKSSEWPEHGIR